MSEHRKQLAEALESCDTDRIVKALEEMTSEVHALWQTMSDFHQDVVHVLRNLPAGFTCEQGQWKQTKNAVAETVSCEQCDAGMDSLAEAMQEGWTNLCRDDGMSWNYLGMCPDCQKAEAEDDRQTQERLAVTREATPEVDTGGGDRLLF